MRKVALAISFLFTFSLLAAERPADRWANAVGGRERIAAVKAIYREGTLEIGGLRGSIKVWHTAEGRYRKEEQVGMFASIETFDGAAAMAQRGSGAPRKLEGSELALAASKAYANSNAVFYVFSPEHRDSVAAEGNDTVVFKPSGVEWRVTLDSQTWLPATMTHKEGDRTVTATFTAWETDDGLRLEKEIHRSMGDPRFDSVITFTKTVINPPIDDSLFSIATAKPAR